MPRIDLHVAYLLVMLTVLSVPIAFVFGGIGAGITISATVAAPQMLILGEAGSIKDAHSRYLSLGAHEALVFAAVAVICFAWLVAR